MIKLSATSTKTNAIALFLVFIIAAGTISLLPSPSVFRDAQAAYDYGMDNYESKDSVILKNIQCNNINVNTNGFELNVLPPFLNRLASESSEDEGNTEFNSLANYEGKYRLYTR